MTSFERRINTRVPSANFKFLRSMSPMLFSVQFCTVTPASSTGFDARDRRDFARASDFPGDGFQHRRRFLRLEFEGNRPARELIRIAEHLARAHIGQFHDGPVDQEIVARTALAAMRSSSACTSSIVEIVDIGVHFETVVAQKLESFPDGLRRRRLPRSRHYRRKRSACAPP